MALPLAARGLSVHGSEASEAMVAKLSEKPGGSAIPVEIGDMAQVRVKDTFDLIYLVYNGNGGITLQAVSGSSPSEIPCRTSSPVLTFPTSCQNDPAPLTAS